MSNSDRREGLSLSRHEARGLTVIIILIVVAASTFFTLTHYRRTEVTPAEQAEVARFAAEVDSSRMVVSSASSKRRKTRSESKPKTKKPNKASSKAAKPSKRDREPSVVPHMNDYK